MYQIFLSLPMERLWRSWVGPFQTIKAVEVFSSLSVPLSSKVAILVQKLPKLLLQLGSLHGRLNRMPPVDPTQDADFMKAAPHEQMAYLSQTDHEFAKAPPQDQIGYLMHLRGLGPISGPAGGQMAGTAIPGQTSPQAAAQMQPVDVAGNPQTPEAATAGLPGRTGNRPVIGADLVPGAIAGGAAAAMAAPTMAGPALAGLKAVGKATVQTVPYVVAGQAIEYARENLPGGKYIPRGAEMIPLFMAGMKGQAEAKAAAEAKTGAETIASIKQRAAAPTTPEEIAAQRYQHVPMDVQPIALPKQNVPTKASTIDPYRNQSLPAMKPGVSGNVQAYSYNPATREQIVHFKSGDIYKYEGVPPEIHNQFETAESQGSYHYNNVRGRYVTTKIGKVAPTRTRGQQISQALGGNQ